VDEGGYHQNLPLVVSKYENIIEAYYNLIMYLKRDSENRVQPVSLSPMLVLDISPPSAPWQNPRCPFSPGVIKWPVAFL
jgi:hypothetical protein